MVNAQKWLDSKKIGNEVIKLDISQRQLSGFFKVKGLNNN